MEWPQISGHKWYKFPFKWAENIVIVYSILFSKQKLQQLQSRLGVQIGCLDRVSTLSVPVKKMIYATDLMDVFLYGKDVIWWKPVYLPDKIEIDQEAAQILNVQQCPDGPTIGQSPSQKLFWADWH